MVGACNFLFDQAFEYHFYSNEGVKDRTRDYGT